ncbi:MAG: GNAT family N-acetyltransferase [Siculibacillus sp.]|nr:GNAT family N-acetyltransferase [Siculibacillus sp.]
MAVGELRVRVLETADDVDETLRGLPAELRRDPFQGADWIETWLAVRAAARPRIVLAIVTPRTSDEILFALPLTLGVRFGVPCWTALDDGVCDYNAPILAADFAPDAATMRWIWARILDRLPGGDLVLLEKLPAHIAGRDNPLLLLDGLSPSRFDGHPIDLGDGIDTVRAGWRMGRTLLRKRRKLARKGEICFEVLRGRAAAAELDRLMGWRDRRFDVRPIISEFYRRLLRDTDMPRLGILRLDGEMIAGCFGIVGAGSFRLLVVAFDEARRNWSPGLLAIDAMIGWAAGEGYEEFDFTIGSEAYKFGFGVATKPLWEIRRSLGLRGSFLLRLVGARRLAVDIARRTMPAFIAARARRREVGTVRAIVASEASPP